MRWQQNRQQQAIDKAELTALKAQIEPHFLFNSLNTIASEIKNDPDNAEQLILKLSDILRYLFDNASKETISLEEEISLGKKYTDLIKARFGDKVEIRWYNSLKYRLVEVPVLLLQPLVENSIRHGRGEQTDVLKITIDISEDEQGILCKVSDNGQGIDAQQLQKLPLAGHALANIDDRLQLIYRVPGLLKIHSEYGQGTTVSIFLPERKK
jgi:LytS/YehU family sensor histidine kinase